MLGRLDEQMEKQDYQKHRSRTTTTTATNNQREEQTATTTTATTTATTASAAADPPDPHSKLQFSASSSSSLPSSSSSRVPLSVLVDELVNQWSLAFLDLARSGDPSAMLLVAQMYLVPKGYGLIAPDRQTGVDWLMKAVELNEGESRELAKRLCPSEFSLWQQRRLERGEQQQLKQEEQQSKQQQEADQSPQQRRDKARNFNNNH